MMLSAGSRLSRRAISVALGLLVLSAFAVAGSALASGHYVTVGTPNAVHLLRPATAHSAAQVEVFLNGTASTTWSPNEVEVPAGAVVTFVLGIIGDLIHNFTLDSIDNDTNLSTSMSPNQVFGYFAAHPPLAHVNTINTSGPATTTPPVTFPSHGVFEYLCEVPGHFQEGMYGHVYVAVPEPAVAATTFSFNYIEIDVTILTTIAVVVVSLNFLLHRKRHPGPPKPEDEDEEPAAAPLTSPPGSGP